MGEKTGRPRGRPKGAKNKRTAEREQAMAEVASAIDAAISGSFKGDAHALLMAVYKDPDREIQLRVDAAKAAIRYEKHALASIEHSGLDGGPIEHDHAITVRFVKPEAGK